MVESDPEPGVLASFFHQFHNSFPEFGKKEDIHVLWTGQDLEF
jgi:hypothetical protein